MILIGRNPLRRTAVLLLSDSPVDPIETDDFDHDGGASWLCCPATACERETLERRQREKAS